jgi:hypothetical protein
VAFHDSSLRRITGRRGRVEDTSFRDLRRLQLPGNGKIPALADILSRVSSPLLLDVRVDTRAAMDTLMRTSTDGVIQVAPGAKFFSPVARRARE